MAQLKELKWEKSCSQINQMVNNFSASVPKGYLSQEFWETKENLQKDLEKFLGMNIGNKKIYATGHQPDLHHPGIFAKDILIGKLSENNQAVPLHIIVDTDYFEFEYYFPIRKDNHAELHQFSAHSHSTFQGEKVLDSKREELIQIMNSQRDSLECFLPKKNLANTLDILNEYILKIDAGERLHKINETIRNRVLSEFGVFIPGLPVSEIIKFESFALFVEKIRARNGEFVSAHNSVLAKYRHEHKIKNHAQPLPDLHQGEMPFWAYENGERISFSIKENPNTILPRAITLTMFLRIFLADFFLHGTGGGRYESVSDQIIHEFFGIEACPYEIATATMNLENSSCFEIPEWTEKDLESKARDLQFSPEKFLSPQHELAQKKKRIQEQFKDPNSNKKELHKKIMQLNEEIQVLVLEERVNLERDKERLPFLLKSKQVFETRTFPFFYYDIEELVKSIEARILSI